MSSESDIEDMNPESGIEGWPDGQPYLERGSRPEGRPEEEGWPELDRRPTHAMRPPSARARFLKAVIPSLLVVFLMILGALVFWRVSQAKKNNKDDESSDFVWRETAPSFSLALPQEPTEQTP